MVFAQQKLKDIVSSKLALAQRDNPSYSLRAFANSLGISAGTLSLFLLGKRKISTVLAEKIADKLNLDSQLKSEIFEQRENAAEDIEQRYHLLENKKLEVMSHWYYFAILNLIETKFFSEDPHWIAKRLNITEECAAMAMENLYALELIKRDDNNKVLRTYKNIRTTDDQKNMTLKKSHVESLDLAKDRLFEYDVNERDYTWLTFPMAADKMPKAKMLIRKFQDDFLSLVGEENTARDVYRMNMQLFPLSNIHS